VVRNDSTSRWRIQKLGFLIVILALVTAACKQQATPFPADIPATPTPTAALDVPPAATIRYGLAANTEGLVSDLDLIKASAQVEQLTEIFNPDDMGKRFDLAAGYGDLPNGIRSPVVLHVVLVINPALPPLNDAAVADVLRRSLDTVTLVKLLNISGTASNPTTIESSPKLRTELANAGWPDGFALQASTAYIPGAALIGQQLQTVNIETEWHIMHLSAIQTGFADKRFGAGLIAWTTEEERQDWTKRVGESNIINLYTLPISYVAAPGLKIIFTPGGWPLASR
jgi:hypothetical protein